MTNPSLHPCWILFDLIWYVFSKSLHSFLKLGKHESILQAQALRESGFILRLGHCYPWPQRTLEAFANAPPSHSPPRLPFPPLLSLLLFPFLSPLLSSFFCSCRSSPPPLGFNSASVPRALLSPDRCEDLNSGLGILCQVLLPYCKDSEPSADHAILDGVTLFVCIIKSLWRGFLSGIWKLQNWLCKCLE